MRIKKKGGKKVLSQALHTGLHDEPILIPIAAATAITTNTAAAANITTATSIMCTDNKYRHPYREDID